MQLQAHKDRFDELGVFVIAMSQEEKDLSAAPGLADKTGVTFPLVHDVEHGLAPRFDRTTAYFIDADGVVRQVFPMSASMRPDAALVLAEIERLMQPVTDGADERPETR